MSTHPEHEGGPKFKEIIFHQYGTYLVTDRNAYPLGEKDPELENSGNVVLVSQPDWSTTLRVLELGFFGNTTVITPELITVAGVPLSDLGNIGPKVEISLKKIAQISLASPETTYIIGSPHYTKGQVLPFNGAMVFEAGKIKKVVHKKMLDQYEREFFNVQPEETPASVKKATVLICRDLIGAQKTRLSGGVNGVADYVRRTTKDPGFAGRFSNAEFIVPGTNKLLVGACWGIGAPIVTVASQEEVNDFYLAVLEGYSQSLLRMDPNLNQIIVCDRAPVATDSMAVSSKPISAVFFK